MKIEKIELKNYRNIESMEIIPCDGINVIYGENAQGKTNILESIFLFTGLKSFRCTRDRELVGFGKDFSVIKAQFFASSRKQTAEIKITDRRRAVLNGVTLPSSTGLMGRFPASLFVPGFMSLIQNGPSERRRFIDSAICQSDPKYAVILSEYTRLLKQRNAVLKNTEDYREKKVFLECMDDAFSSAGDAVYLERKKYLELLLPYVGEIYNGLSSGKEEISFSYIKKGDASGEGSLKEILKRHEIADISSGMTLTGPHRDDIDININGVSARSFGSQGQKRSAAIALKLGEAEVIKEHTSEQPVILLDDVMSELDSSRQDYILNHIKDKQVFITCCDPSSVGILNEGRTFNIVNGKISER
ncbi:MAG: DNA replication/repair protein RecF [Clostridia bacterium]|nr:DNA replication/repair protein RecF [Clostridia bacterium]